MTATTTADTHRIKVRNSGVASRTAWAPWPTRARCWPCVRVPQIGTGPGSGDLAESRHDLLCDLLGPLDRGTARIRH